MTLQFWSEDDLQQNLLLHQFSVEKALNRAGRMGNFLFFRHKQHVLLDLGSSCVGEGVDGEVFNTVRYWTLILLVGLA